MHKGIVLNLRSDLNKFFVFLYEVPFWKHGRVISWLMAAKNKGRCGQKPGPALIILKPAEVGEK